MQIQCLGNPVVTATEALYLFKHLHLPTDRLCALGSQSGACLSLQHEEYLSSVPVLAQVLTV